MKLKLDGLLDVEADEGKKQLKLNVDKEALCRAEELDGCYALKTDLPREVASKEIIHDRYKGLSEVEWAFRRERSIAHLLIVVLAYKMERYLRSAWKACKELLKRVNVTLPEVLPYRETHVATRKKLNSFRKRK